MPKFNPDIHRRSSIRLKNYDYAQAGAYFVTVCAQDRMCMFGDANNREIQLSPAGKMVNKWWNEIKNKFPNIQLDEYIIMPNHFHGIIVNVGADLCVCPDLGSVCPEKGRVALLQKQGEHIGSPLRIQDNNKRLPLQKIIQWFKTMTTNEYIREVKNNHWPPVNGRLWQRNYYEHIIRNEKSLNKIREYITNNPLNWITDIEHPDNRGAKKADEYYKDILKKS